MTGLPEASSSQLLRLAQMFYPLVASLRGEPRNVCGTKMWSKSQMSLTSIQGISMPRTAQALVRADSRALEEGRKQGECGESSVQAWKHKRSGQGRGQSQLKSLADHVKPEDGPPRLQSSGRGGSSRAAVTRDTTLPGAPGLQTQSPLADGDETLPPKGGVTEMRRGEPIAQSDTTWKRKSSQLAFSIFNFFFVF